MRIVNNSVQNGISNGLFADNIVPLTAMFFFTLIFLMNRGQFGPVKWGHFHPVDRGQFHPVKWGQFRWNFHTHQLTSNWGEWAFHIDRCQKKSAFRYSDNSGNQIKLYDVSTD